MSFMARSPAEMSAHGARPGAPKRLPPRQEEVPDTRVKFAVCCWLGGREVEAARQWARRGIQRGAWAAQIGLDGRYGGAVGLWAAGHAAKMQWREEGARGPCASCKLVRSRRISYSMP